MQALLQRIHDVDHVGRLGRLGHGEDAVNSAVTGGDDYELLFAVRPRLGRRLGEPRRHGGTALTRIGVCTAEPEVLLKCGDAGHRPLPEGYQHFR